MTTRRSPELAVWDRLWSVLFDVDESAVAYVYRVNAHGEVARHYAIRCDVWPGLVEMLRDDHGGGVFQIRIRSGRVMKFSGQIAIESTPATPRA